MPCCITVISAKIVLFLELEDAGNFLKRIPPQGMVTKPEYEMAGRFYFFNCSLEAAFVVFIEVKAVVTVKSGMIEGAYFVFFFLQ